MSLSEIDDRLDLLAAEYDWAASRSNLEAIGKIVQRARSGNGIKPVSDRREVRDTGLDSLAAIITSLPEELRYVKGQTTFGPGSTTQYVAILDGLSEKHSEDQVAELLQLRGEHLPILIDITMYDTFSMSRTSKKTVKALVLRLGGEVSLIDFEIPSYSNPNDPIRHRMFKTL